MLINKDELSKVQLIKSALEEDYTQLHLWLELAEEYKKNEEHHKAASTYKSLIDRKEEFDANLYFELGYQLAVQGKDEEASKVFFEQRILQSPYGVSTSSYDKNENFKKIVNYTEYYERYEVNDNTILYESYHGVSISCSPFAIFKSIVDDSKFLNFTHVFVINDKTKIPQSLKKNENIIFIKRDCDLYLRYLCKSKYLINNSTFPSYFIRKKDQLYLNTWHGTPLKYMGKDIKNDFMSHSNVSRNFLHATHLIQPNSYTANIMINSHDIHNLSDVVVAETGYPRQDLMFNITLGDKKAILNTLNITNNKKIVLYAPTWRGVFSDADFDTAKLVNDIKKLSELKDVTIIFRGHYSTEKIFQRLNIDVTIVPTTIDTNSLLSVVDVLITDYSSIMFDFMALARPIIYYTYDKDDYESSRGFYLRLEELGGDICYTVDELKHSVEKAVLYSEITTTQKNAQEKFCPYDDGFASKRVVDLFFFDKISAIKLVTKNNKKSILLYGGNFTPNGINTSYLNLLNNIDKSKYNIVIAIDPKSIKSDEKRMEQFQNLHENIQVIPRVGSMIMTVEEQKIKNDFAINMEMGNAEKMQNYTNLYQREFKRIFGYAKFDAVVEFNGYDLFWPSLLMSQKNNSIYQHNDMHAEWKLRFPYLKALFEIYKNYNKLISVSEQTMQHNFDNLSEQFYDDKIQVLYCDNVQNPVESLKKSKKPIEIETDNKIFKNSKVFINIARLSPEKDQEKLIRAFKEVSQIHADARLVNLGSGPLEHELLTLIKELKLEKKVFFLGQRLNPYPYLKQSDCFILSSNHEGQPMTLFEAMILNKPIIATGIVGNKSVLEGRQGHLVENSKNGLVNGMKDFLEGRYVEDKTFDYEQYNQDALDMFYEKVIEDRCGTFGMRQ